MSHGVVLLDNHQCYTHVMKTSSSNPERILGELYDMSYSIRSSRVRDMVSLAYEGHNGVYKLDPADTSYGLVYPSCMILQDQTEPGTWYLDYITASGRNQVQLHKYEGGLKILWIVESKNPPSDSTAVREALSRGWVVYSSVHILPEESS